MREAVAVRCDLTLEQLELIETALDQMCWRDRAMAKQISQLLLEIRLHKTYGARVNKCALG